MSFCGSKQHSRSKRRWDNERLTQNRNARFLTSGKENQFFAGIQAPAFHTIRDDSRQWSKLFGLVCEILILGQTKSALNTATDGSTRGPAVALHVFFRNRYGPTYYCTTLIREGVTSWSQLMHHEHSRRVQRIPPTWRPVSLTGQCSMQAIKPLLFEQPSQWGLMWGRGVFLSFLAGDREYPARQGEDVWGALGRFA